MTKAKLTATLPDGTIATRTTARTYTHIIACARDNAAERAERLAKAQQIQKWADNPTLTWDQADADRFQAEAEAIPTEGVTWFAADWCGRPDLAAKAAAKREATGYWAGVRIVEVDR
jgi:hypothetical protein